MFLCQQIKHLNGYNDVPTIQSEELYSEDDHILSGQKISSCIWNIDIPASDFEVDNEGNISIVSVEGHAKVTLLRNKFVFTVEYLQLLPKKCAAWSSQIQGEGNEQEEQSNQFNFHKDFLEKYNLKRQSKKTSNETIKLAYSYFRLRKLYTIFAFPERWTLPLFLLWSRLERQEFQHIIGHEVKLVHRPVFPIDFIDFISHEDYSHSYENISFKNHIRGRFALSRINENEASIELPNIGMTAEIRSKSQIASKNLWTSDEVIPIFDQPRYPDRIQYAWKAGYSVWLSQINEIYLYHDYSSQFIYSTTNGKYFHEVEENDENWIGEKEKVVNVMQMWREDEKSILLVQFQKLREHDVLIAEKKRVIDQPNDNCCLSEGSYRPSEDNTASLYSDNYEILHSCQNEFGKFDAFKNGCLKIIFKDRTILRWMKGSDQIHIISRFGDQVTLLVSSPQEFQEYVDRAIEFREYCFTNPKEKVEKERRQQELHSLVNFEINKNERFLTILKGQVPANPFDPQKYLQGNDTQFTLQEQNDYTNHQQSPTEDQDNSDIQIMIQKQQLSLF